MKIRGLLGGEIEPPDDAQLRAFFDTYPERFERPATWTIEQVYYTESAIAPADRLQQLRAGLDPGSVGEHRLNLARHLPRRTRRELVGIFGSEATRAIVAIDDDQWHGPLASTRGTHFVRITGRTPIQKAGFDAVASYLASEWMIEQSRQRVAQEVSALRRIYDVVIEDENSQHHLSPPMAR